MNKKIVIVLLFIAGVLAIRAATVNDVQTVDGAQRNKLQDAINTAVSAGGGGGGGGGDFSPSTNWSSAGYVTFGAGFRSIASSSNLFHYLQTTNINFGAVAGSSTGRLYWDGLNEFVGTDFLTINRQSNGAGSLYIGNSAAGGSQINASTAGLMTISSASGQNINFQSGATIMATFNQTGNIFGSGGTSISNIISTSATFDPPSIATLSSFQTNLTLVGAKVGSSGVVRFPAAPTDGIIYQCWGSNDVLVIRLSNVTALSVDPASQTIGGTLIQY